MDLAPLSDPDLLPQAVISALNVREEPGCSVLETLVSHLRSMRLLLLLDNCEHLLAASASLAETVLRACSEVRILATSREALGITGEQLYRVPSLGLPTRVDGRWSMVDGPNQAPASAGSGPSTIDYQLSALMNCESVHLFVERARLSQPHFQISEQNAPVVAQVCDRLDGIPLAIELAAARVSALTVEQIAGRLQDRFRLLTGGSRTALPRQQTLRALIDWSYDLLTEPERVVFQRLSVFAGGWTLEAAEAVCGCMGVWVYGCDPNSPSPTHPHTAVPTPTHPHTRTAIQPDEVLDLLTSLVRKSLVLFDETGNGRYRMLETVRQYARDRLVESASGTEIRDRHLPWFLGLAEEAARHWAGEQEKIWLDRLEPEQDNFRAALDWALEGSPSAGEDAAAGVKAALRLTTALSRLWEVRGFWSEGRSWLERAIRAAEQAGAAVSGRLVAGALNGAGTMAWIQADFAAQEAFNLRALSLWREAGDRQGIAFSLNNLGVSRMCRGDYTSGLAFLEETLQVARAAGSPREIAFALGNAGDGARHQGDYGRAASLFSDALEVSTEMGDQRAISDWLMNLGAVLNWQGDYQRAAALHLQAFQLCLQLGDRQRIAECLEDWITGAACRWIAGAPSDRGKAELAARIAGAADALREATGALRPPFEVPEYRRTIDALRAAIGGAAFETEWETGRRLTMEAATSLVLHSIASESC